MYKIPVMYLEILEYISEQLQVLYMDAHSPEEASLIMHLGELLFQVISGIYGRRKDYKLYEKAKKGKTK